jgi:3-methyladenine DNA glycosylase AlkD
MTLKPGANVSIIQFESKCYKLSDGMVKERAGMSADAAIEKIKSMYNPANVSGMTRYGINSYNTYGVSIPVLRKIAKEIGKDHEAALKLWKSGIHEARLLAGFVDDPRQVTEDQMEAWVKDFDSWDICDQACSNLFDRTSFAYRKAVEWSGRDGEYVKRAGYVLMAALAVHDKRAVDEVFLTFLPIIKTGATDERNFVKKAVNWALRQIGKRNANLNQSAIKAAEEIRKINSKSARWIASDALRELTSGAVAQKIMKQ